MVNSSAIVDVEPMRGEGPGVITPDGCAVEVYLKLPYRDELQILAPYLPSRCSVLEMGCGVGRLTRALLEKGFTVTAVDNSADMLRYVPEAATKICCDIERLELNRTFDVVLLASNLINVAQESIRRAQLTACRRHLSQQGVLLFQRFDPNWLRSVQPGPFPSIGEVEISVERAIHCEPIVHMSVRYAIGPSEWKQHFSARLLDDDEIRAALAESGLSEMNWIDAKWGVATGDAHAS